MPATSQLIAYDFAASVRIDPARVKIVTPPAMELWTAADASVQQILRLDSDADTTAVDAILAAAREFFEKVTGLALITQTIRVSFDRLPSCREIQLPRAPLQEIDEIVYTDSAGAEQTFASASYATDVPANEIGPTDSFGRVRLIPTASWPDLGDYLGALRIQFLAGFGDASTYVPADLRFAVLLLAKYWYEQSTAAGTSYNPSALEELPAHLQPLIARWRVSFIA